MAAAPEKDRYQVLSADKRNERIGLERKSSETFRCKYQKGMEGENYEPLLREKKSVTNSLGVSASNDDMNKLIRKNRAESGPSDDLENNPILLR